MTRMSARGKKTGHHCGNKRSLGLNILAKQYGRDIVESYLVAPSRERWCNAKTDRCGPLLADVARPHPRLRTSHFQCKPHALASSCSQRIELMKDGVECRVRSASHRNERSRVAAGRTPALQPQRSCFHLQNIFASITCSTIEILPWVLQMRSSFRELFEKGSEDSQ